MEIGIFREALRNLADLIDFRKRGLCADAIVLFTRDCSEITILLAHLEALLVEQYADIDPGMAFIVVLIGLYVCPET
jgi:hypothetical protein